MSIKCCYPCKPPKRYPGCHGICPEYAEQKAQHDKETAEERKKTLIQQGLNSQKYEGVRKAAKIRKHQKGT